MYKVPRWVFRYVGNKAYDFSSKKKGFFAQKRPNLAQNWHFWSIWARPCRLILCPVGGSVGGCGAWAVSRKTPIYFILFIKHCALTGLGLEVQDVGTVCVDKAGSVLWIIHTRHPTHSSAGQHIWVLMDRNQQMMVTILDFL